MDLVLHNGRIAGGGEAPMDIGIKDGRIVAVEPGLAADAPSLDLEGRLVVPGFIETHIHLDKSRILGRCQAQRGDLEEAIQEVAKQKRSFTAEDVYTRAKATLERAILQGTTHMRTHLEVDPGIGLRGFEGVLPLVKEYAWAIDLEICIFPQEGLLNNPGTEELMLAALTSGGTSIGAAPYTDSSPHGQIDRVFAIARELDIDIDMHLDFAPTPEDPDLLYVCEQAEKHKWGGRVAIGHVTKLSTAPPAMLEACARRMADAGVALTVLPSTDLYLMGRHQSESRMRGVTEAHRLLHHGVNCSLSTNNVLNPFTPFGDCSLVRMANLYANIAQVGSLGDTRECLNMVTTRSARLLNLDGYGVGVGCWADLAVLDAQTPEQAVAEIAPVLLAFKRGRQTLSRPAARLLHP
ncbi:MAG: amidohydrolase family protein [Hyphomicrobiaceae bacterium]|nr:amidohydrolase family protein [Hyphomicrobiaceae bacterium]